MTAATVMKVVKYGEPVLEKRAVPVEESEFGGAELKQFVADMFETMYASKGVGLAAPQVGVLKRLAVIDVSSPEDQEGPERIVIINPEIVLREGSQTGDEGCLSIPGFREEVTRAERVVVRARDEQGEPIEIDAAGLKSRALQHEIDHLDGVLFINRISPLKRDLIRRKIKKLAKAGEWD
jgi:peptide deformylase